MSAVLRQQSLLADGDAMSVAAQIVDDVCRAAERRLHIHHPFGIAEWLEVLTESFQVSQRAENAFMKFQFTLAVSLFESCKK